MAKVLHADAPPLGEFLAENVAALVAGLAKGYSHVLAPATSTGKDVMPRAAALADAQQISDIVAVESPDTFVRPIYAGNALATVKSSDAIKFITVRTTAFDAVAATGGSAAVESAEAPGDAGLSSFVGREVAKSERPELTSARVVVSGGRRLPSVQDGFLAHLYTFRIDVFYFSVLYTAVFLYKIYVCCIKFAVFHV